MTDFARHPRERKTYSAPLTNAASAVKGEIACLDTSSGLLNVVGTSTTLIPIGNFHDNYTGDGSTPVLVELFEKLNTQLFLNDSAPNALTTADRGAECYLKDGRTVSALSTGRSVAGIVLNIDPILGVEVLFGLPVKGATGDSIGAAQSVADRTALAKRRADGLCTVKQARIFGRMGLKKDLTFAQAKEAMDMIVANNWHVTPELAEKYGAES